MLRSSHRLDTTALAKISERAAVQNPDVKEQPPADNMAAPRKTVNRWQAIPRHRAAEQGAS